MKKIIVAIGLAAVVISSHAQGIVLLSNTGGSKISTNAVSGGAAAGLTGASASAANISFYYALYVSSGTAGITAGGVVGTNGSYAFNSGWTFAGMATNSSAGRLASASLDAAGNTMLPTGFAGGNLVNYVIVGWSSSIGSTVNALTTWYGANGLVSSTGWVGESAMGSQTPGIEGSTGATPLFGASPLIGGFTLGEVNAVPEPGTLALAALGGASLLMFRRKK